MEGVKVHIASLISLVSNRFDPTRTTTLCNRMIKEFHNLFDVLVKDIIELVVTDDAFGLSPTNNVNKINVNEGLKRIFAFKTSSQKIEEFNRWLQSKINAGLLQSFKFRQLGRITSKSWMDKYITEAYKKGLLRSRTEMRKAGYNVPSMESTGGVDVLLQLDRNIQVLELLYTRAFSELQGITAQMEQQLSRILAQGFIDGSSPKVIAQKLVAAINGKGIGDLGLFDSLGRFIPAQRRAEILAVTELVRAHHLATISEYRSWGMRGVTVTAEWKTAGDDKVCSRCKSLEGNEFTLDEIEGMIPLHPRCRCMAMPVVKNVSKLRM